MRVLKSGATRGAVLALVLIVSYAVTSYAYTQIVRVPQRFEGDIEVIGATTLSGGITLDGAVTFNTDVDGVFASAENLTLTHTGQTADTLVVVASGAVATGLDGISVAFTQADDADATDSNAAVRLTVTGDSGDADTLVALDIVNLAGASAAAVTAAIRAGNAWDNNFICADTSCQFQISNTGIWTFEDDAGNDLLSMADLGAIALGSVAVGTTSISLVSDGTGTAELVLVAGAIDGTEILDDTVVLATDTAGNYVASANTAALTGLTGGSTGSEAAALSLAWDYTATIAADPALGTGVCVASNSAGGGFVCESTAADTSEGFVTFAALTADRTYTFRDATGTVILSGDTFTGDVTGTLGAAGSTGLTVAADAVALATDTTGNYVASVATAVLTGLTGGAGGSEGAAIALAFDYTATLAADPALAAGNCVFGTTGLICEGSGADGFEGLLTWTNPTADRTLTARDASGTIIISGDTFTGDVTGTLGSGGSTALTVAADSVALTTDTTGNYVAAITTSVLTGLTGGVASEGATAALAFDYSATTAANPALATGACVFGTTGIICEDTADTSEGLLLWAALTGDRAVTFRDATGTAIISGDTFTGDVTATLGAAGTSALTIAADAVAAAEILDITRALPLPLGDWKDTTTPDNLDFSSGADAIPNYAEASADILAIEFDDTAGSVDTGTIAVSTFLPPTWVSSGTLRAYVNKDAETGANTEILTCAYSRNLGAFAANGTVTITGAGTQVVTLSPTNPVGLAAGDQFAVRCAITSSGTMDDIVDLLAIEYRYTATQ